MNPSGNLRKSLGQEAYDLCRVGEYRKAAILALKARRTSPIPSPKPDLALPTSLVRCGRGKSSLKVSLDLLSINEEPDLSVVKLIYAGLASSTFDKDELLMAFAHIERVRLKSKHIAGIASHILSQELRELFLQEAKHRYRLGPKDEQFIHAIVAYNQGDGATAMRCLQELITAGQLVSDSALLMATILNENGNLYLARRYACLAIKHDNQDLSSLDLLGQVFFQESRWKAARRVYELIYRVTGDDISMLNMRFTLPLVALSVKELSESLISFQQLATHPALEEKWMGVERSLKISTPLCHSFFLAYQGSIGLREFIEQYNDLVRFSCRTLIDLNQSAHGFQQSRMSIGSVNKRSHGRIRIGFISKNFHQHSNLQAHDGLIRNLDHRLFEVVLIHRQGSTKDFAHSILNESADEIIYLENDFGGNCKRIAELQLDILFFTDVGMYPLDSVLAMVGLAPKQVTGWGIPHTSGIKEIDFYMRSTIFNDCEESSHYTETLFPIEGYIGYFEIDETALAAKSRDYFLLPPDRFLIGCLQSIHKIHPDFDEYLEAIACIDESILIVIAASETDALNHRFVRRLRRSAPTAYGQICFVQKMNMGDYYSLNQLLDLNLDTVHYGAGITFIQTAWCGPPCVTQRANTVRSSVVSRSYEYAGISNPPIASTKEEYVLIVESLFNDEARRLELRKEIQEKCQGTVYNNKKYLQSCQDFFLDLASNP